MCCLPSRGLFFLCFCGGLIGKMLLMAAGDGKPFFQYVDIAEAAGLNHTNIYGGETRKQVILETTGNGVAIFDYDNDGWNDILITNGTLLGQSPEDSPPGIYLYRNSGSGSFEEVGQRAGLAARGWAQGACVADYDNDGNTDVLVTFYGQNALYRNRGDGTFEDVTRAAGLGSTATRWGSGCAFLDYDRDGKLDLFVANYVDLDLAKTPRPGENSNCIWKGIPVMCGPVGLPPALNSLYHNRGNGTFEDVSRTAGILDPGGRYSLGVIAADFDNDAWPDIYVACDQTPSLLYHNLRDGTFKERGMQTGVAYNFNGQPQAGMGVAAADYDGNGFFDIVKTNFSGDLPSLYNNEGEMYFTDVSNFAGLAANQLLGWGVLFLDGDEDGWKDIYIANGHVYPEVDRAAVGDRYYQKTLLYRNLGNGTFEDITEKAGPAFGQVRASRGMAAGDLDGDGHPEIVIVNMNGEPSLLKNAGARKNRVLVELEGKKSNRSAVGARVTIEAGQRRQTDEVRSGGSYYSHNAMALHFGLGEATQIDCLEVRWPAGGVQEWQSLPASRHLFITEGVESVRKIPLQKRD